MQRKLLAIPASVLVALGLVACGNNDGASGDNQQKSALPMGYSSNEQHEESGGNASWLNEDNDGPFTEMMDHTLGGEGKENSLRNVDNEAAPQGEHGNTLFSRSDRNYHGHLNDINGGARSSYYTAYDGKLAKRVADTAATVVNVADARAIVHEDKVIVGAVLEDTKRQNETKSAIRNAVGPYLNGKSIVVVTDDSTYGRIRNIDNDLREGGPKDQLDKDIDNMFKTISNQRNKSIDANQ